MNLIYSSKELKDISSHSYSIIQVNIRKIINDKGITIKQLAFTIDKEPSYLYRILNSKKGSITLSTICSISAGLNIDITTLLNYHKQKK